MALIKTENYSQPALDYWNVLELFFGYLSLTSSLAWPLSRQAHLLCIPKLLLLF